MIGLRRKLTEEDGVSAVIFAVSITALLASAVLAIDAGSLWNTRRKLVTDTDAAALAAARLLNLGGVDACEEGAGGLPVRQEANHVFQANQENSSATLEEFAITPMRGNCDLGAGSVRVGGRLKAPLAFGGIVGLDEVDVYAASTAQYGHVTAMSGLAPLALCANDEHIQAWSQGSDPSGLELPTHSPNTGAFYSGAYGAGRLVNRIRWEEGICPGGRPEQAASWAWLDFDGPPDRDRDLQNRLTNGYPGVVRLDNLATPANEWDCNLSRGGSQACSPSKRKVKTSTLRKVKCQEDARWEECKLLWIVVYDKVTKAGEYEHFAFWGVALRGWSFKGDDDDDDDDDESDERLSGHFLDLEFTKAAADGSVGPNPAGDFFSAPAVPYLCGVEYAGAEQLNCEG